MTSGSDRRVTILGNGGFGTALSLVLHAAGAEVRVWGYEPDYNEEIDRTRENPRFLPGVTLPEGIRFVRNLDDETARADVVFSVIPTQFLRATLGNLKDRIAPEATIVSCSKGFERGTAELPSQIVREVLPGHRIAVLSGPSHAEEIARRLPTTVVVASEDASTARSVQELVTTEWFRTYTSSDPLGVEIGGAAKNVIAVAAGIAYGLGFGDNAGAALVCRGASELTRLGVALGARRETVSGLSGIGDLIATCTSRHSRNREVGRRLAQGESLDDILSSTETVAEGVETTRSVHKLATDQGVDLPITREVHAVLFEGKDPKRAVKDLMTRELKDEVAER